jgi:signal transduction histidine kinase
VLIMIVVSAIGGLWLAARVISPVTELARRVRDLPPDGGADALAEDFSEDEVGELARVFDRYLERIQAFIERERSFTEDVSHELRTPLTVINGATEVLLRDVSLVGRARQRVQRVARAGRGMSDLTEALLVLAREKTDSARPASECSVEEVLSDTVESHRYLLVGKPVEVTLDVRARPTLMVDRAVLGIVLGNLIRNACTYTEAGEIRIELDADRVTVRDSGIGIPGTELDQVFERHYRGSTSKGSGIGLSLVKRICERYGWTISIQSEEGKGATAQLILGGQLARQVDLSSPSDTVSAAQS